MTNAVAPPMSNGASTPVSSRTWLTPNQPPMVQQNYDPPPPLYFSPTSTTEKYQMPGPQPMFSPSSGGMYGGTQAGMEQIWRRPPPPPNPGGWGGGPSGPTPYPSYPGPPPYPRYPMPPPSPGYNAYSQGPSWPPAYGNNGPSGGPYAAGCYENGMMMGDYYGPNQPMRPRGPPPLLPPPFPPQQPLYNSAPNSPFSPSQGFNVGNNDMIWRNPEPAPRNRMNPDKGTGAWGDPNAQQRDIKRWKLPDDDGNGGLNDNGGWPTADQADSAFSNLISSGRVSNNCTTSTWGPSIYARGNPSPSANLFPPSNTSFPPLTSPNSNPTVSSPDKNKSLNNTKTQTSVSQLGQIASSGNLAGGYWGGGNNVLSVPPPPPIGSLSSPGFPHSFGTISTSPAHGLSSTRLPSNVWGNSNISPQKLPDFLNNTSGGGLVGAGLKTPEHSSYSNNGFFNSLVSSEHKNSNATKQLFGTVSPSTAPIGAMQPWRLPSSEMLQIDDSDLQEMTRVMTSKLRLAVELGQFDVDVLDAPMTKLTLGIINELLRRTSKIAELRKKKAQSQSAGESIGEAQFKMNKYSESVLESEIEALEKEIEHFKVELKIESRKKAKEMPPFSPAHSLPAGFGTPRTKTDSDGAFGGEAKHMEWNASPAKSDVVSGGSRTVGNKGGRSGTWRKGRVGKEKEKNVEATMQQALGALKSVSVDDPRKMDSKSGEECGSVWDSDLWNTMGALRSSPVNNGWLSQIEANKMSGTKKASSHHGEENEFGVSGKFLGLLSSSSHHLPCEFVPGKKWEWRDPNSVAQDPNATPGGIAKTK